VDDEPDMAENVGLIVERAGYETTVETESTRVVNLLETKQPDLVVTDLMMPEMNGVELLEEIKVSHPQLPVIVVTAFASVDSAVEAMKKGASDYLSKPFSPEELLMRVEKALAWTELKEENRALRERFEEEDRYKEIIGESSALQEILRMVDKVAATEARVLLVGESGTGKELIARNIHRRSSRRNRPFFAINCGALPENLLESELFGHERGAFTGAVGSKKGIFEVADGGTFFLDEVSETSGSFQTKLLRVLQDGEFLRVGGTRPLKTDVRLISATNQDLHRCISDGRLREDLFYRLSVIQIQLPPLRERSEDIPLLVSHFLSIYSRQIKKRLKGVCSDAMDALGRHSWPGNIRELENVIERAVIMADGDEIRLEDLPSDLLGSRAEEPRQPMEELKDMERELLLRTLRECRWNRSRAAKKLGIGRRTLYDKLARLGIPLSPSA
jgi:DNA-binding NtrC family response regulator